MKLRSKRKLSSFGWPPTTDQNDGPNDGQNDGDVEESDAEESNRSGVDVDSDDQNTAEEGEAYVADEDVGNDGQNDGDAEGSDAEESNTAKEGEPDVADEDVGEGFNPDDDVEEPSLEADFAVGDPPSPSPSPPPSPNESDVKSTTSSSSSSSSSSASSSRSPLPSPACNNDGAGVGIMEQLLAEADLSSDDDSRFTPDAYKYVRSSESSPAHDDSLHDLPMNDPLGVSAIPDPPNNEPIDADALPDSPKIDFIDVDAKTFSGSENKLLVVYPFDVEDEKLLSISSRFKELGGDSLGVDKSVLSKSATDGGEGDYKDYERYGNSDVIGGGYITIREDDKERLEPGQYLNDTLVDFWMSWLVHFLKAVLSFGAIIIVLILDMSP